MNQGPILVTGRSRSGKSLMSKLLGSHPNIATHNTELRLWPRFYHLYGDLGQRANFERCLAAMLSYKHIRALINDDTGHIRKKFWEGKPTYGRLFALFLEYHATRLGKPRWGDQSQSIECYTNTILTDHPTAKIIHMIRDPRDRYSCLNVVRRRRGERKKIGSFQRQVREWQNSVCLAEWSRKRYPDRYKIVRYEALVSQLRKTLHDVCAFLDEADIPPPLLAGALRGFRDDHDKPKGDGVSTDYVGCFRKLMPGREIAFIQIHARRAMSIHNYDLEPVQLSLGDYVLLHFVERPIYSARQLSGKVRAKLGIGTSPGAVSLFSLPFRWR